ncbi:MAG: class I SAM-dependent methyltransferase [Chloroflexota bacterium]
MKSIVQKASNHKMLPPTQRFSNRVENYIKYRPGYPAAIIDLLKTDCQLTQTSIIADAGSGTGLLSKLFLDNGNKVFGIEPNNEMRAAGEMLLKDYPNFISINATAEATTLADDSVDFVSAGQAFHWFKTRLARQEFGRILKPQGWIVLVWNERQREAPFLAAYEQMLERHSPEYKTVSHTRIEESELAELMGTGLRRAMFDNEQVLDYEGVKGRLLSSSYAPLEGQAGHRAMIRELQEIYEKYQERGRVRFKYQTKVYYSQV